MSSGLVLAAIITAVCGALAFKDWRWGLLAIIVVGVAQDVLRKMTPGVPAYFLVWPLVYFVFVATLAYGRGAVVKLETLWLRDDRLRNAFYIFIGFILLQCFHSLVRWGSPAFPIFGAIFYFGPIVSFLVVCSFASREYWVKKFVETYLWVMVPIVLTVYLSLIFKNEISVLKEIGAFVGNELLIYDVGTVLYSYSGLLRVGEIASWHAATCIALLSMLLLEKKGHLGNKVIFSILIILLVGAILLTGRRKMLMAICLFWTFQFFLLNILRTGWSRRITILFVLAVVFSVTVGVFAEGQSSSLYLERGRTVFFSVGQRVSTSVELAQAGLYRSSSFGLGAGVAAQGARYAGANTGAVGGSSESGIGLLAVELGIPGILIIAWLGYCLLRVSFKSLRLTSNLDDAALIQAVSFFSLLIANVATFMIATQLFGDFFILIVLGMIAGMFISSMEIAKKKAVVRWMIFNRNRGQLSHR